MNLYPNIASDIILLGTKFSLQSPYTSDKWCLCKLQDHIAEKFDTEKWEALSYKLWIYLLPDIDNPNY